MLEAMRRSQRWIMWIVIVGVGFVFVVFVGSGAPPGGAGNNLVVEVDGRGFDARDVDRIRRQQEEQYRRVLGAGFDQSGAAEQLDTLAANILVSQAVLAREAERMGLVVGDGEIRQYVRNFVPGAVDENGQLRSEGLKSWAENEFGTESHFVELIRMDALSTKLRDVFFESLGSSDAEARESILHQQEEVSIAYVALDTKAPSEEVEIDDARIDALLASDEPRVRDRYAGRLDEYEQAESVQARHILLRVEEGASEEDIEAVRIRAEETLARVRAGADFVDVALEVSEDPGSKDAGGDLGWVERGGDLAPALEEVAFGLEPGALSEVVQTPAGFHLLRVEERREAAPIPFEDVQRELAREILVEERAGELARELADGLAEAVAGGESLVDAVRAQELTLERTDPLRRRPDGYIPGLGPAPDVLAAAFALEEDQPTSPRLFEVGDRLVLIELLERVGPSDEEIQVQLAEERERLTQSQRLELPQIWLDQTREQLAESGKIFYDLSQLR
jgi:peptidyl-prolyl cis-trans isomerase D